MEHVVLEVALNTPHWVLTVREKVPFTGVSLLESRGRG